PTYTHSATGLAMTQSGQLVVALSDSSELVTFTPADGSFGSVELPDSDVPTGIATTAHGRVFVAAGAQGEVVELAGSGVVSTVAGVHAVAFSCGPDACAAVEATSIAVLADSGSGLSVTTTIADVHG